MVEFFRTSDPVGAYLRGVQGWLKGVVPTGTWDGPTHDAFYKKLHTVNPDVEPVPWGAEPEEIAAAVAELIDGLDDSDSYSSVSGLPVLLGLPTSYPEWRSWVASLSQSDADLIDATLSRVRKTVLAAEQGPRPAAAPTAPSSSASTSSTAPSSSASTSPTAPSSSVSTSPTAPSSTGSDPTSEQSGAAPAGVMERIKAWPTWKKALVVVGTVAVVGGVSFLIYRSVKKRSVPVNGVDGEEAPVAGCSCGG